MTKPVHAQAGAGSAFHPPFCPDGRAALSLRSETGCSEQNRPFLLVATIIASAMAFIDATVVTIALPPLQADLDATFQGVQWVVNAYALFLGALILVGGGAATGSAADEHLSPGLLYLQQRPLLALLRRLSNG
jgi:hypothetical protein